MPPKPLSFTPHVRKLLSKGIKHQQAGRVGPAERFYRRSLKADPRCPQALHLLGLLAQQAGRYEESIRLIGESLALNPDDVDTLKSLAESCIGHGQMQPASQCFQRLAELRPQSAEAHHRLGKLQERLGEWEAALASYRRAVALQPDSPELHGCLARLQHKLGAFEEAVESCRRALALDPNNHEFHMQLGNALTDLKHYPEAVEALRRALALKPDSPDAVLGLGYFFAQNGDLASARDSYRTALKLDPRLMGAYLNLGTAHILEANLGEAAECFEQALKLEPDSAEARSFLGLIHLTQGNYSLGWGEYEDRRGTPQFLREHRTFREPLWKGEPLEGSRILLFAEQGLGDTLQFIRYVPLVAARGGKVILEVPSRLHRLLQPTPGAVTVIRPEDAHPEFDWQCPLLSLPLAFRTELNTIPAQIPYVHPDPAQAETWRERLTRNRGTGTPACVTVGGQLTHGTGRSACATSLRIGLVWGGSAVHPHNSRRSVSLAQLAPLTKIEGTTFYSLQMGTPAEQVKQLRPRVHLIDLQNEQKDFADTAAIVANLDLVISIDTSVAHLAGAMGKPLWILLYKSPDWRWLLEREDSPWYPTARLFRQVSLGNWQDVVNRVEEELRKAVTSDK